MPYFFQETILGFFAKLQQFFYDHDLASVLVEHLQLISQHKRHYTLWSYCSFIVD